MKTLDEVIEALEICGHDESPKCPYFDTEHWCCCEDHMRSISPLKNDALHYLREYRDKHDEMLKMEEALGYCEMADNNPLTWQELKQMEGKPVWVESNGANTEFTGWAIIRNVLEDRIHFIFSHYDGEFLTYEMAIPKECQGKTFQVYRKERS